jgi:glycosyltransferase 2 family protein
VKSERRIWKIGWRLGICGVLLFWILHAIFRIEGQRAWDNGEVAWKQAGQTWSALSRSAQWQVAWSYGPPELWHTLSLVKPTAFVFSLGFMGLTVLLGALRWRMVLRVQGLNLPLGRTLEISLVAQFFNAFLLGSTGGDLLKAYYAARETHHKKTEAVVTVFVDRLIGLFSMLVFACVFITPNFGLLFANRRLSAVTGLVLSMTIGCAGIVGLAFWGGVSRRWPSARQWLRRLPKAEELERSVDACRQFGRASRFLVETLLLSMVLNLVCVLQFVLLAWGLDLPVPMLVLAAIVPMIICISALPVTPSGLGVRESLYVVMLADTQLHIAATKAFSLSLLAYAGFLFWSLVGGVVYLSLRDRQHLAEVTAPDAGDDGS